MRKNLRKILLIGLGVIVAIGLAYLLYRDYRPEINLLLHPTSDTKEKLLILLRRHAVRDSIFLLCLIAVLNAIPGLSNSVLCVLAGLCYGAWLGLGINWLGNILGNVIVVALIRKIDFSKHFKKNKILTYLMNQSHPRIGLTIGFMIPFIPSVLVNYAAARLDVTWKQYLPMVVIGMLPTSYLYAFGGDAIFSGDAKRLIGLAVGILVLLMMALLVVKLADRSHKKFKN